MADLDNDPTLAWLHWSTGTGAGIYCIEHRDVAPKGGSISPAVRNGVGGRHGT